MGGLEQEVVICPPSTVDTTITTYPAGGLEQEVVTESMEDDDEADAFDFFSPEPIGSKARDLEREQELAAAAITTYPAGGFEEEVVNSPPVLEPEVAICPPVEVDATITTYPAAGLEEEMVVVSPIAEPEVAVCPPMDADATITTYPAGGLEQEVVISPPAAVDAIIMTYPAGGLVQEVVSESMEDDDEADAFDFFSPEPIGSKARDLEREQELAASAAAAASSQVTTVTTSSETSEVDGSAWVTETESVIITTT